MSRLRSPRGIALIAGGALLGLAVAPAHAATVVDSAGSVTPCPLKGPARGRGGGRGEPVFCRDGKRPARRGHAPGRGKPPATARDGDLGGDAFRSLGGGSPFCGRRLSGDAARNCRSSGALSHPYPIGNYGLDIHINTGVTRIGSNLMMAIQTLIALVWLGLLYMLKGVLLALEWAFSLDLLGAALSDLRQALLRLHSSILGEPWLTFALACAGMWGIWRGFVQRRTTETVAGLAGAVALMVVALVLIHNPTGTVGEATKMSNEASLGLLAGASTGSVSGGERAFGSASARLFDTLALRPWCALEFGDVRFCLAHPPSDIPADLTGDARASRTAADLWLRFPAGGAKRNALYEQWRGDGDPLQPHVRLQKEGQTATRLALLLLIGVGLVGALSLLGWLGFKLLVQAVLALLLLLAAPAVLLAPAFGDSGRALFIAWGKRLIAALLAKALFALLLALVLVAAGLLAQLRSLGFIGLWVLQIVFWWGLFHKRADFVGWLTVPGPQRSLKLRRGIARRARDAAIGLGLARAGVGRVLAPAGALGRFGSGRAEAKRAGTQSAAHEALAGHADEALQGQLVAARTALDRDRQLQDELRHTDRFLSKYDKQAQLAKAKGERPPTAGPDERAMLARREALGESRAPDSELRQARSITAAADRNLALQGREFTERDRDRLIAQRRRDLEQGLPVDHERNLRFAGIDPAEYFRSSGSERARLDERARESMERDRNLLAALPEDDREQPTGRAIAAARLEVPHEAVRERVRRERAARSAERSQRTRRRHVYRRR